MLTLTVLAVAVLCWPQVRVSDRLVAAPNRPSLPITGWSLCLATGALGAVMAGAAGAAAGMAATLAALRHRRRRREGERSLVRCGELAEGLRLLVGQLRAGAHPAIAAEGVAAEAGPDIAAAFRDLAATARLGGELTEIPAAPAELREPLGRLVRAWAFAERHGVELAEPLDSVRRDLERRTAFRRAVEAKLAGPRTTALVLTGLPILGVVFGQLLGAQPLAVLTTGGLGRLLLLTGTALLITGALWSERLTEAVWRP